MLMASWLVLVASTGLVGLSRAQTAYPACSWPETPENAFSRCSMDGFSPRSCALKSPAEYLRICTSDACATVVSAVKAAQPTECQLSGACLLYANVFQQLDYMCNLLAVGSAPATTQPPSSSVTTTPAPRTITPARPVTTATPTLQPRSPTPTQAPSQDSAPEEETATPTTSVTDRSRRPSISPSVPPSPSPETLTSSSSSSSESPQPSSFTGSSSSFSSGLLYSSSASSRASTDGSRSTETSIAPTAGRNSSNINQKSAESSSSMFTYWIWTVMGLVAVGIAGLAIGVHRHKQRRDKILDRDNTQTGTDDSGAFSALDDQPYAVALELRASASVIKSLDAFVTWRIDAAAISDVSLVGRGAQGAVYLVRLDTNELVVSKRLVPDQFSEAKLLRFVAEIQVNAVLQHPSIVSFIGVAWTTPYDLQLLFEHMPRGDLRTHLDRNMEQACQWDDSKLQIALNIAQALVYVHSFNPPIVHRDIKARNVMLDSKLSAKLTDFGVAREQSEDGTMTTGIGTNRWLAPEVIRGGGTYNEKCDIYSLGVLLTELDTHRVPYDDVVGVSEIVLLHHVSRGELRPTVSRECDGRIQEVIEACVVQNPSERLNAMEVAYKLRQIIKTGI